MKKKNHFLKWSSIEGELAKEHKSYKTWAQDVCNKIKRKRKKEEKVNQSLHRNFPSSINHYLLDMITINHRIRLACRLPASQLFETKAQYRCILVRA